LTLRIFGLEQLLDSGDEERIKEAITVSEKLTSGEIRVHIDKSCDIDIFDRAAEVFNLLKMDQTELRNGVLIYLSKRERKFAIIGDSGINKVVEPGFWNETAENMSIYFKSGEFAKGILEGIESAGKKLQKYFPYKEGDKNELDNSVSFDDNF
jgi:uncharacterized membrane protein